MPRATPQPVPFPIRGMDLGSPSWAQPEATGRLVRNAHGFHQGNSYGGGKRPGFVRQGAALSATAGSAVANRCYHLAEVEASPSGFLGTGRILAIFDRKAYYFDYASTSWQTVGTGGFDESAGEIDIGQPEQVASLGEKVYAGIGAAKYIYDTGTPAISTWSASAGTIPDFELYTTFRARVFGARLASNPSFWACSRINAPLDWDYNADPITSSATAGTVGDAGQPTDVVTALCAFADDRLIFGCHNSLYELRGDPQAGGKVVILARGTGIVGGRAWTFDDQGTLWFLSLSGLYRLPRGAVIPEPVSLRRMDAYLDQRNVGRDASGLLVQMGFDAYRKRVLIFFTERDASYPISSSQDHVVYDVQADEFVVYTVGSSSLGPLAVTNQRGPTDDLKSCAISGDNGGVLVQLNGIPYDGTSGSPVSIDTRVEFAPQAFAGEMRESSVRRLHFTMANEPSFQPFNWYWIVADSADECDRLGTGDAAASGTVGTASVNIGRAPVVEVRARGVWHKLIITQDVDNGGFRISRIDAEVDGRGRVRL